MKKRINITPEEQPKAYKAMMALEAYLAQITLSKTLKELIKIRASQINGCAFCLDMHSKDLRAKGEPEQRLYVLDAWRDAPFYTERERAALAWAEAVTKITGGNVPDEIYSAARKEFSEEELIDLTLAVVTINCYNRINISFRTTAGSYQPGAFAVQAN